MTTHPLGRHRAAVRPKTPLSSLTEAVSANAGTVGRRSAVIAASSGLVVTMGLPAADAAPVNEPQDDAPTVDVAPEPVATVEVAVPADAQVTLAGSTVATATAPPPPPPPPVEEAAPEPADSGTRSSTESVSRSSDREAVASETVEVSGSEAGGSVMEIAARYDGIPYRYGGSTPAGFDCSGFVQYVWKQLGVSLPRTAAQQQNAGRRVSRSEARPGDIVSFVDGGGVYHNGLYAGNGMLWDSPRTGKTVSKRAIWTTSVTYTRVG